MTRCRFCGLPAGFLRRQHAECFSLHQKAVREIPRLFLQVADSPIAAERFSELLHAAAKDSFVRSDELKSICAAGIDSIVNRTLQSHALYPAELQRVSELVDALGAPFPDGLGLDEKLIKLGIVGDLADGKIPAYVSIVGPTPLEFGEDETVLWVFTEAQACGMTFRKDNPGVFIVPSKAEGTLYFGPDAFQNIHINLKRLSKKTRGDLIITNQNIYFLGNDASRITIPIDKIGALRAYAEGVYVVCRPSTHRTRLFLVNDAWFATNVIVRLVQISRDDRGQSYDADEAYLAK